ncbi:MAG: glutamate--tRNA ligase [Alphaproteobacteria bacterium]
MTVPVTRFAPSPTGFLHIGGARTALFNWLFARAKGGVMRLRIEDTDRARSSKEAIAAIIDGLEWLGIDWQGEPVFQNANMERHQAVAAQMLANGNAYKCFCSPQELDQMRALARAQGRSPRYDGTWANRDPGEAPAGAPFVVRLRSGHTGETLIDDQVQGPVKFANDQLDDLVLLRSDATPTYMLAVVVDDYDMGVTHVIRGDDHLTNAARQTQIYQALGWPTPAWAHIPLIHGADGAKLSKRHGALGLETYRAMGYLPEALRNYLVRLGWSHGDQEYFGLDQLTRLFDLSDVNKSAARLDLTKLESVNSHYIRAMDDNTLMAAIISALPHLLNDGAPVAALSDVARGRLRLALPSLKERAKSLNEILDLGRFVSDMRPLVIEDKAAKHLDDTARATLGQLLGTLGDIQTWNLNEIEKAVRGFADSHALKLGKVAQPLRAALTGRAVSPGIFDVLLALGRDEALMRINDQATNQR